MPKVFITQWNSIFYHPEAKTLTDHGVISLLLFLSDIFIGSTQKKKTYKTCNLYCDLSLLDPPPTLSLFLLPSLAVQPPFFLPSLYLNFLISLGHSHYIFASTTPTKLFLSRSPTIPSCQIQKPIIWTASYDTLDSFHIPHFPTTPFIPPNISSHSVSFITLPPIKL